MNPLLAQFIPEARELLDRASNGVLALEREPGAEAVINEVFRAVHTLKGTSGLFDIAPLMRLAHAAEDLLDEVRGGELDLNSEMVDNLLTSLDLIGQWISELEGSERLPDDAEAKAAERAKSLRAWLEAKQPTASAEARGQSNGAPPQWIAEFSEADRLTAFKAAAGLKLTAWTFDPEEDCFFRGDDPIGSVRHSPALLLARARPPRGKVDHRALCPRGGSQEALLGRAQHGVTGHDQVIEHAYIDQGQRSGKCLRERDVRARFGFALARMVMK